MSENDSILVLIVRGMALRSTLAARLEMNGIDTCTAHVFNEKLPPSARRASLVLVTDRGAIDGYQGGTTALLRDPQWRLIVVLGPEDAEAVSDPRLVHLADTDAAAALVRLLAERRVPR